MCYNDDMIYAFNCAVLSAALQKLQNIVRDNEERGLKTIIFCEDRLSLAAERTVCSAVGGTFDTAVYTFARFISSECGKPEKVLSGQGSAMVVRKLIEDKKEELTLFRQLSSPSAAQTVYDTIALLYSSRITAEETAEAALRGGLLGGKLHDLAVIYSAYENYLEETGYSDRNGYLRKLPQIIENSPAVRGNAVVFLGFQALTCMAKECVRASFSVAAEVNGLFIGGAKELYVNEAFAAFTGIAEEFGGAATGTVTGNLPLEGEILLSALFNPESYFSTPVPTDKVTVFEAEDEEEELEYIAASVKKHVAAGERFGKISVMLPDLDRSERVLSRVFSRFRIPYYADRQRSLAEHSVCSFVTGYLGCSLFGCAFADVDGVIASPYFPATNREKDAYRNYLLRFANYRGGVRRPVPEGVEGREVIEKVRETFLDGLSLINRKGGNDGIYAGLCALLEKFKVRETLDCFAEKYKNVKPTAAQFSARAYDALLSVLREAADVSPVDVPLKDFLKIFKSGLSAMKISLIPPKADAVFVGDLSATANTGSNVVFAAGLTGDVPGTSADTSLLTDREISALESVNLNISPKIRQVNARRREICGLNICAFRKNLYLSYPARLNGEECSASEIISYAGAAFLSPSGSPLARLNGERIHRSGRAVPYYCSEKLPALKYLRKYASSYEASSVYGVLRGHGYGDEALSALSAPVKRAISRGKQLYTGKSGSLSPSTLETYFACPYLGFIRQGIRAAEREEGAVRAVDTGNFIHSVLQDLAKEVNSLEDVSALRSRAEEIAKDKLSVRPYSALADSKSGEYVAEELAAEAVKVSEGMYEQLKNSSFKVVHTESSAEVMLSGGIKIYGRIDRVDECGDLVRVVDYKTGNIDSSPAKYYMGAKLQLPLYLKSAAAGKRPAGAYYFPASLEYRDKQDGVFRLQGFMDGSDDVVAASDSTVKPKEKSGYVEAYYQGRKVDCAMASEDFSSFIDYSVIVADGGAREMLGGNINPSPAEGTCKYCKAGGSCGLTLGRDGEERKSRSVKCSEITAIVRKEKGE